MDDRVARAGGAFLVEEATPDAILTPEELTSEARLMAKTMEEFVRKEVLPVYDRLEAQEAGLMRSLLTRAGALGLLATGIPERYEGLDLPRSTIALMTEKAAPAASFALSVSIHTGVAMLPLLYFGTPDQKQRHLPKMASGETIGAFALSEANSGSDALAAQTKATLSQDGKHYRLNGTKMWTTNGGFADLFTIFAQVEGDRFTAFLVERDTPGLTIGREEYKLGLKGSSTCRLLLENALVPAENVLGEVGQGHRPALYALNIGRFNIGASALGSSKEALRIAVQYAKQRVQFGRSIAQFGLIQQKLAEMAIRIFLLESMIYRVAGYWDKRFGLIDANDETAPKMYRLASEEYAIECALIKFYGTEVHDFAVDEALQIHGGFGFSEEFPMARAYRDARVTRIFEGTNEINRLTVVDQLLRREKKGRLALGEAARRSMDARLLPPENSSDALAQVGCVIQQIRRALLLTLMEAQETLGDGLLEQQELAAALADRIAALFALESGWLRLRNHPLHSSALALLQVAANDASEQAASGVRLCRAALYEDRHAMPPDVLPHLDTSPVNTVRLRRELATFVLERGGYPF